MHKQFIVYQSLKAIKYWCEPPCEGRLWQLLGCRVLALSCSVDWMMRMLCIARYVAPAALDLLLLLLLLH